MKILSLGAGVQSSTLALMAEHGEIDKPDFAIFADTGWEPKHCYDWLDWLETKLSYPVLRVSKGNIKKDLITSIETGSRFAQIPFFIENGITRRQCTNEYKIVPIQKKMRELLGYQPRKRIPENSIELYIGISLDEVQRMKPSRIKWVNHSFPLIEKLITRQDCLEWMKKHQYPTPPKSSCIGCPFHSNQHWKEMKASQPNEFYDACDVDKKLREKGLRGKLRNLEYMHRSLKPLIDADLGDEKTVDMFGNECEGMCGV